MADEKEKNSTIQENENIPAEGVREIRISVRSLVEFLLRSGDLKKGRSSLADRDAMQAGSRAHRRIQSRRGPFYTAEVPLSEEFLFEGDGETENPQEVSCPPIRLVIEGRADGIEVKNDDVVIEEIKGIYQDPEDLEEPVPVHLAQARCYAAIYGKQNGIKKIGIHLTYCSLEDYSTRIFRSEWDTEELYAWFRRLAQQYLTWARLQVRWENIRNRSAEGLSFPFPYREGQRDMTAAVYQTIRREQQLFVQAPTGIGKTMSAIFPSVYALCSGTGDRIFYLTAKTIARTVAEEAFAILKQHGLRIRNLTITAKEKICVCDEVNCRPESCPRARGHFDRVNDALFDLLENADDFSRETVLAQSEKYCVCPYELQIDLTDFADCVICDYNYVFDPDAKLARYFGDSAKKRENILLVDEAHNLVSRGRDMYSASIEKEEFLRLRRLAGRGKSTAMKKISRALTACNKVLLAMKRTCGTSRDASEMFGSSCLEMDSIGDLAIPLMNLAGALEEYLTGRERARSSEEPDAEEETHKTDGEEDDFLSFYFSLRSFLNRYEEFDENSLIYGKLSGDDHFSVHIACVNPASRIQRSLDKCRSTVFFSATLLPIRYYEGLLTTKTDSYSMYIPSPFDRSNRLIAVGRDVSSRYSRRGPEEYRKIAGYINSVLSCRSGNYLIFFPSYRMMDEVLDAFLTASGLAGTSEDDGKSSEDGSTSRYRVFESGPLRVIAQSPGMTEEDRERFLKEFSATGDGESLAAFCVMGGIFAEGIDLAGEKLIGAIVVGTGLPQVSAEREMLKRYYDRQGKSGFDFAYRYPGMNKVLQAAGRVIRTEEDTGVILLLDDRFLTKESLALFPGEWNDLQVVDEKMVRGAVASFWGKIKS